MFQVDLDISKKHLLCKFDTAVQNWKIYTTYNDLPDNNLRLIFSRNGCLMITNIISKLYFQQQSMFSIKIVWITLFLQKNKSNMFFCLSFFRFSGPKETFLSCSV